MILQPGKILKIKPIHLKLRGALSTISFLLILNFKHENITNNNENKVFVVGMTRSGTSLIEQILSSHNNIYGAGELNFIQNIVTKYFMKNELDFQNLTFARQ